MKILPINTINKSYNIYIGKNIISQINKILNKENINFKKSLLVIDKNVPKTFIKRIRSKIKCKQKLIFSFNASEKNKNFLKINQILDILLKNNFTRNDLVICIGGGIAGDVSGFAASIFKRGLKFVNIPSTLLSQVDSSIGGKTGINNRFGKNLIGSFYQPDIVLIDPSILKSLSLKQLRSGYAEILKYSLINDAKFYHWLKINYKEILNLNANSLVYAILKSVKIKSKFIQKDEKEKLINSSSRAMLNFGHTFGHALETFYKYKKLTHGEAISIGMVIAAKLSKNISKLNQGDLNKIINHFEKVGLPINDVNIKNKKIINIVLKDKKNLDEKLNLVLIKRIGQAFYLRNQNPKHIFKLIN